jgi:hypothetical protein
VKRDAAIKANHSPLVGRLVQALTPEPQSTRAWEIGSRGEEKLAATILALPGVNVLNDRRVPGSSANIDHIVIAPAGIFVVDAKLHKGLIRVRNRGSIFRAERRLYIGSRDRSELAWKMGRQLDVVIAALDADGVDPLPPMKPVLCFVDGSWPLLFPPDEFDGVRLESERSIKRLFMESQDLDASAVDRLTRILAAALPSK